MDTPTVPTEELPYVNDYPNREYRSKENPEDKLSYEEYDACIIQRLVRTGLICFQTMSHYSPV